MKPVLGTDGHPMVRTGRSPPRGPAAGQSDSCPSSHAPTRTERFHHLRRGWGNCTALRAAVGTGADAAADRDAVGAGSAGSAIAAGRTLAQRNIDAELPLRGVETQPVRIARTAGQERVTGCAEVQLGRAPVGVMTDTDLADLPGPRAARTTTAKAHSLGAGLAGAAEGAAGF